MATRKKWCTAKALSLVEAVGASQLCQIWTERQGTRIIRGYFTHHLVPRRLLRATSDSKRCVARPYGALCRRELESTVTVVQEALQKSGIPAISIELCVTKNAAQMSRSPCKVQGPELRCATSVPNENAEKCKQAADASASQSPSRKC